MKIDIYISAATSPAGRLTLTNLGRQDGWDSNEGRCQHHQRSGEPEGAHLGQPGSAVARILDQRHGSARSGQCLLDVADADDVASQVLVVGRLLVGAATTEPVGVAAA